MSNELKAYLEKVAAKKLPRDDDEFMINDYAGGNIDDAYYNGEDAGEVLFARTLLEKFFKS